MNNYVHMLKPLKIKKTLFKNRVLASPITTNRVVKNGAPTPESIDAYETKARGGFAQVTLTESFVDFEFAARHDHGLDLVSPDLPTYNIESLAVLTEAIKAHGAVASIQLNHVGGVNHPDTVIDNRNPIGPSAFVRPDGIQVDEMDEEMMHQVAAHFANACGAAKSFGFDMVMLHGGHGWLLSQFISPLSNKRKDKWGGSLENRARFPLMVLDAVRKEVGDDFLIEYRVSGDERVEGGMGLEETAEYCRIIEDKVDLIHVTSGIYHSHVETKAFSSMFDDHGCNIDLAAGIKTHVKVPVVAVGGFNDPELINRVIEEEKCDFVALGRQQFADPDFVKKTYLGITDEIAPCLRCSCFNPLPPDPEKRNMANLWHCTVNPMASRELRWRQAPKPEGSRDVLVIGGGVAGLYAAITAAKRGHKVTLVEKRDTLGGHLWFTEHDEHKGDLKRYKDSLITRATRAGVNIELNTQADEAYIKAKAPYALIAALGSQPSTPPIPGIENAKHAFFVYTDPEKLGKNIVIVGGGLIGCETAYLLGERGHNVTVLEMREDVALDANDSHRRALLPRMEKYHNVCKCSVTVTDIQADKVSYIDEKGNKSSVTCDTVLYAIGMKCENEQAEKFRNLAPLFYSVGDCNQARLIKEATYEGFCAAMDIL